MAHCQPSAEYRDYCKTMKEGNMSYAYRCDKCGQFRDEGPRQIVSWYGGVRDDDDDGSSSAVDLCPDCAPPVVEMLEAIAATKHEGSD